MRMIISAIFAFARVCPEVFGAAYFPAGKSLSLGAFAPPECPENLRTHPCKSEGSDKEIGLKFCPGHRG
jgi:hypothetical protein